MEGFIRRKVADGMYGNATKVIRDAVRRMQAAEARVAACQQGDDTFDHRGAAGRLRREVSAADAGDGTQK
ncbi:MAG: ribbon-helix-helix domain-containing protein, partial [Burkholderiaceae bacterium]